MNHEQFVFWRKGMLRTIAWALIATLLTMVGRVWLGLSHDTFIRDITAAFLIPVVALGIWKLGAYYESKTQFPRFFGMIVALVVLLLVYLLPMSKAGFAVISSGLLLLLMGVFHYVTKSGYSRRTAISINCGVLATAIVVIPSALALADGNYVFPAAIIISPILFKIFV